MTTPDTDVIGQAAELLCSMSAEQVAIAVFASGHGEIAMRLIEMGADSVQSNAEANGIAWKQREPSE